MSSEEGLATIETVVAIGLSLLFFAILTNFIVIQYALGVATAALDEGVRQGARSLDPVTSCEDRARATFSSVEGGAVHAGANLRCFVDGAWLVARIDGTLDGWAPPVPDMTFVREARAPLEDLVP
ncbi:MAG: hypothetical protein OEX04_16360 [Acidimicrobiia bacterium]|nr:hypothetical protein [Acidimicrobiia bacterium]MDH4309041.1 hypothetical protein [Acidimicrobiia bacterium]MDH5293901.1 hypothetical protein [Acidimicrobiia bacterium]